MVRRHIDTYSSNQLGSGNKFRSGQFHDNKAKMKNQLRGAICAAATLGIGLAVSVCGQVSQDHPELCGTPSANVPLPHIIVGASVDHTSGVSTLTFRTGSITTITLPGVHEEIRQICPMPNGEFVVFGWATGPYDVIILDKAMRNVVNFYAYDPVMSPNQRWIIMRHFYPPQSELPNEEEYLLYDLNNSPADNEIAVLAPETQGTAIGQVVYPVVPNNAPFLTPGVPENQLHRFRSSSFYWAPDSAAVAFADSVQGVLSVVLVSISGGKITTVVKPQICSVSSSGHPEAFDTNVTEMQVGPLQGDDRVIQMNVVSDNSHCKSGSMVLHLADFEAPAIETHQPRHYRKGIVDPK